MDIGCGGGGATRTGDALFDQLRRDGLDEPGVTRDPYGPGEQRAHATVDRGGAAARSAHRARRGSQSLHDPARPRSRRRSASSSARISNSVPHGGNFDGAAGVVAGLVAVAALQRPGIALACDLTVMGIRAEESIWFQVSYIGSRGALGTLPRRRAGRAPDRHRPHARRSTSRTAAAIRTRCARGAGTWIRPACRLSGTAHRAGAEPGRGRPPCRDLHRHSRQLPLSRRAHRGQPRPCRPAPPLPPRCCDGGRRIRHGARSTCGRSTKRTASRWPARSAASTPIPRRTA